MNQRCRIGEFETGKEAEEWLNEMVAEGYRFVSLTTRQSGRDT